MSILKTGAVSLMLMFITLSQAFASCKKWEYKLVSIPNYAATERSLDAGRLKVMVPLTALGEHGWELVNMEFRLTYYLAYMKRCKSQ